MTGKDRLNQAFEHKDGPLLTDIGGMPTTGMHCITVEKMREFYGLEKKPIKIIEPMQMLGEIGQDLKEAMGIGSTPLWGQSNMFGFAQSDFVPWTTPWGQDVLVPEKFVTTTNDKGDVLIYAESDTSYPPSACMPVSGYYFDSISRGSAFDEDNWDVNDNLEEFRAVSDDDLTYFKGMVEKLKDSDDAVLANLGGTAIGDIALVPGPQLKQPKGLRDIEEWYVSTVLRQDELHQIFSYQTDMALKNLEKIHNVLGDTIQVAYVCGTDLGTQNAPFISNQQFIELYMPYYKRINGWIHENTSWKTFKHCCGSIFPLVELLIESGFDILNPVQWTAQNMDRNQLKNTFGKEIVFWGGGVDTQHTLPFGTPDDVFAETLECCQTFGKGGGFVFSTIHNIQPLIPAANLDAMVRAIKKYNQQF